MQVPYSANSSDSVSDTYEQYPRDVPKNRCELRTKDGYLEPRNVSTSNITEDQRSLAFNYKADSCEDQRGINRNVNDAGNDEIYSDEMHGAREKNVACNKKAFNSSNIKNNDKRVTQSESESKSSKAALSVPFSKEKMPYSSEEMSHMKKRFLGNADEFVTQSESESGSKSSKAALSVPLSKEKMPYSSEEMLRMKKRFLGNADEFVTSKKRDIPSSRQKDSFCVLI